MILAYNTVKSAGEALHIVQKSKFIAVCKQVFSEQEAAQVIDAQRKKYYDARHHCYAWITDNARRSSDDGEPSGTAGAPILDVLSKNDMQNAIIVVTRYFGGVLLGTGGLVRAYSSAAVQALNDAEIVSMQDTALYRLKLDYSQYSRITTLLKGDEIIVMSKEFFAHVEVCVGVLLQNEEDFCNKLIDQTEGKCEFERIGQEFIAWPTHKIDQEDG